MQGERLGRLGELGELGELGGLRELGKPISLISPTD